MGRSKLYCDLEHVMHSLSDSSLRHVLLAILDYWCSESFFLTAYQDSKLMMKQSASVVIGVTHTCLELTDHLSTYPLMHAYSVPNNAYSLQADGTC